jgi:cell division protein ZapA
MSAKKSAEVLIDGRVYNLSGYEEEGYLQKVASYINSKLAEFKDFDEYKHLSQDLRNVLLEINIADDYFKAKDLAEKYESDITEKDKNIYDLKHELIGNKLEIENLQKKVASLENDKTELLKNKEKLEASLEDALLGPVDSSDGD